MLKKPLTRKSNIVDVSIDQLEQVLTRLLDEHEQLIVLLKQKRLALCSADHKKIFDCCKQENEKIRSISELEEQRLRMVAELTAMVAPSASEPMRMADLAEHLPEPMRGRLLVQRSQLKERMDQARCEINVAQRANESLFKHMNGLIQTISSMCSGLTTYGRTGLRPPHTMAASTINTTA